MNKNIKPLYVKSGMTPSFQDLFVEMYPEFVNSNNGGRTHDDMCIKNVTFVTNEDCNLACTYCYECHKDRASYMSKEVAKKAIEKLFDPECMDGYVDPEKHKGLIIEFIGGEPFLNVDVMDFVCDYFRYYATIKKSKWAKYHMFSITTNGTLLQNPKVLNFINKNKSKLSVSITIDGNKELHDACRVFHDGSGSYDIVAKNVRYAIDELNLTGTKVTFAPENITKINTAIPHLFELGLKEINANCVFENVWQDKDAPIFYKELVKLADYIIDNKIYEHSYCSIFDETLGGAVDKSDDKNWCFKAGTYVLTPYGNRKIEDLKAGDLVTSDDGSTQRVEEVLKRYSDDTASIRATGIFKTHTTTDHPYLVKKFKDNIYEEPKWMEVKDIKKGDKIALYCHRFGNIEIDEDIAYLIGRYIGKGRYLSTGYELCCNYSEFEKMKYVMNRANIKYSVYKLEKYIQFNINNDNNNFISILSQIGCNNSTKNIPIEVFNWNEKSVETLLKGIIDASGYINNRTNKIKFNTLSFSLFNDILILLRGLKYFPTCRKYTLRKNNIKPKCEFRYEICYDLNKNTPNHCEFDKNISWSTVKDINLNCKPYDVYNLTVANTHTFIANGSIVHNCGGDGSMLAIGTDGSLYPCIRFMKYSLQTPGRKEIKLGNLDKGVKGRHDNPMFKTLCSITRSSQSPQECMDCPVSQGCAWCTGYNYDVFGTPNKRATFICKMHKARLVANWYFWNRLYKTLNLMDEFPMNLIQEDIDFITEGKGLPIIKEAEYND